MPLPNLLIVIALLASACAQTTLRVAPEDPASTKARSAAVGDPGRVLDPEFVPPPPPAPVKGSERGQHHHGTAPATEGK